jgi:N-hydroxyarylamine O-acetyltransferase
MSAVEATRVSLERYLHRVGYDGPVTPSSEVLHALHLAHATHIPFENLDVLLGRGVNLDPAALERKLVSSRRGGYCFEHNLLFADVLAQVGFDVTLLSARVRFGAAPGAVRPRTHMLLLVRTGDTRWIADVGFGSHGLLHPVPFDPAAESDQFGWKYRVAPDGGWWLMQLQRGGEWMDLYAFTLEAHERIDYEVLNHFTATHPRSIFRSSLMVQLPLPGQRIVLRDRELTVDTGTDVTTRTIAEEEVTGVLRETFGIEVTESAETE